MGLVVWEPILSLSFNHHRLSYKRLIICRLFGEVSVSTIAYLAHVFTDSLIIFCSIQFLTLTVSSWERLICHILNHVSIFLNHVHLWLSIGRWLGDVDVLVSVRWASTWNWLRALTIRKNGLENPRRLWGCWNLWLSLIIFRVLVHLQWRVIIHISSHSLHVHLGFHLLLVILKIIIWRSSKVIDVIEALAIMPLSFLQSHNRSTLVLFPHHLDSLLGTV